MIPVKKGRFSKKDNNCWAVFRTFANLTSHKIAPLKKWRERYGFCVFMYLKYIYNPSTEAILFPETIS